MIEYKIATEMRETVEFSNIALQHRLYVIGWNLQIYLKKSSNGGKSFIVLAYENEIPIGIGHYYYENGLCNFFVRKEYRRRGIGSKLVQEVKKNSDKDKLYAHFGISESKIFFEKMDIRCYY